MVIMYCNLVKTQAFPLAFRVSSRPICTKPSLRFKTQSFSHGFNPKPSESLNTTSLSNGFCLKTVESVQVVKPRNFSSGSVRARSFSNGSSQKAWNGESRDRPRKNFPWIAGNKNRGGKKLDKVAPSGTSRSSWEECAEKFLSKNGGEDSVEMDTRTGVRVAEVVERGRGGIVDKDQAGEMEEIQENDEEVVDDPRWDGIKTRYRRMGDRETGSGRPEFRRREKQEDWGRDTGSERPEFRRREKQEDWGRDTGSERPESRRWNKQEDWGRGTGSERPESRRWNKQEDWGRDTGSERPEFRRWNKQEDWGRKTWNEATESTLPQMTGEGIYGVGPILASLSAGRREFYTLYVQEGLDFSSNNRKKKDKRGFEKVLRIAEKLGLTKKEISKHDLNMLADNRPHQGLVLDASPLEMIKIRELEPVSVEGGTGPLWVALDEVTDPQNLGAIIRSSYFFGAEGVVLCAKNSAPLSGVVSKASAGSLELMELRSCKNMMQFLSSSADNGWRVIGGSVSSRALPLNEVPAGAPTILVLGSEGTGLRPLVERSCTQLVKIPGNIPVDIPAVDADDEITAEVDRGCSGEEFRSFLAVESLNVSVAAGVLLHHLVGNNNNCHLGNNQDNVLE